jgi:hypothetical protein
MGFNSGLKVLNSIFHLLTLLEAHPILHVSRIRVNEEARVRIAPKRHKKMHMSELITAKK